MPGTHPLQQRNVVLQLGVLPLLLQQLVAHSARRRQVSLDEVKWEDKLRDECVQVLGQASPHNA